MKTIMRLKSIFLTATVALAGCLNAQAQILYKVSKAGSDKTSYLMGTHHFAPLSVIDSIAELPEILGSIDKLYGELDMSAMSDPAVMMSMQQKVVAPADSTLEKVLSAEDLAKVQQLFDNYAGAHFPLEQMYMVKPAILMTQLAQMLSMKVFPELAPGETIDGEMQARARKNGKQVLGLETFDEQMDMLLGAPIAEQAKDLMKIANDPATEEEMSVKLSVAYLNHDMEKVQELMAEAVDENPEKMGRMIFDRNARWLEHLQAELPASSLMIVVGAGHLPGDRGVIEGLRKAGYTVTAVK